MNTSNYTPVVGDWVLLQFGFDGKIFYIAQVLERGVMIGRPSWCVSSLVYMSNEEFQKSFMERIGASKRRWWWKFLPFRDVVCPFKKPKELLTFM